MNELCMDLNINLMSEVSFLMYTQFAHGLVIELRVSQIVIPPKQAPRGIDQNLSYALLLPTQSDNAHAQTRTCRSAL